MISKDIIKEYVGLKIDEKRIKARVAELGPQIKQAILDDGMDKLPTTLGDFNIKRLKKWTYSEAVKKAKEDLDALIITEEADGTATFVMVEQLEFREKKNGSDD